jgi:hypothetical protein
MTSTRQYPERVTIRLAVKVAVWANQFFGRERMLLKNTFKAANEILVDSSEGGCQPPYCLRMRLPKGGGDGESSKVEISDGLVGLPVSLRLASGAQEKKLQYSWHW